ncbi:MAG: hypothetical protein AAGD22_04545 [Verrucomicrobiota bacterium]
MKILGIVTLTMTVLAASPADARLGETLKELEARFGKGRNVTAGNTGIKPPIKANWHFEKNGIRISANFIGEKCGYIYYQPLQGSSAPRKFPPEYIAELLKVNVSGSRWISDDEPRNVFERLGKRTATPKASWYRADGKAYAIFSSTGNQVTLVSEDYIQTILNYNTEAAAAADKKNQKRLEGF